MWSFQNRFYRDAREILYLRRGKGVYKLTATFLSIAISPFNIQQYSRECRSRCLSSCGGFPKNTPLLSVFTVIPDACGSESSQWSQLEEEEGEKECGLCFARPKETFCRRVAATVHGQLQRLDVWMSGCQASCTINTHRLLAPPLAPRPTGGDGVEG